MPDSDYDKLCRELDDLTLDYLSTFDSLLNARNTLETRMKSGYVLLSKARYSMGTQSVGRLQYDEENMTAKRKIEVGNVFTLIDSNPVANDEKSDDPTDKPDDPTDKPDDPNVIRRRKGGPDDVTNAGGDVNVTTTTTGIEDVPLVNKRSSHSNDPLRWFGVLVPQALRTSQDDFTKSLPLLVEIANSQRRLLKMKKTYRDLLKSKSEMKPVED